MSASEQYLSVINLRAAQIPSPLYRKNCFCSVLSEQNFNFSGHMFWAGRRRSSHENAAYFRFVFFLKSHQYGGTQKIS